MNPTDKEALVRFGRRFAWMTLVLYAGLTLGLWLTAAIFPDNIGPVTDYTVSISLIGAVTFGGLYAAALALRPGGPKDSPPADAR